MDQSIQWYEAVEKVRPYIVRIVTPYGAGTGFVVSHSEKGDLYGVATAAHVVAHAHEWGLPIRIEHDTSGQNLLLQVNKRAVLIDETHDSAALVFEPSSLTLPKNPAPLIDEGKVLKVGVEIGWLGFPALSPKELCFFHGRISAQIENDSGYLVDGVAINGVSGGPALWLAYKDFNYVGVVSAYVPNRATGEVLPGLALVRNVAQFYGLIKQFKSIDDAQRRQSPPEAAKPDQQSAASPPSAPTNKPSG